MARYGAAVRWRRKSGDVTAEPAVTVQLTHAEALVLFEWLAWLEDGDVEVPVAHPADRQALYGLSASLDTLLVDPFMADYGQRLAAARAELSPAVEED